MIKKSSSDDYPVLENLEKECFPSECWNLIQIISHHEMQNSILYIQEDTQKAVGYIFFTENPFELEILRIGVLATFRRTGISEKMLDFLIDISSGKKILLEVKSENLPAIALYKKKCFINYAIRKRYYPDGKDAILMKRESK